MRQQVKRAIFFARNFASCRRHSRAIARRVMRIGVEQKTGDAPLGILTVMPDLLRYPVVLKSTEPNHKSNSFG